MMKLGMIGMSPNNAHPYSWAAIINGEFKEDDLFSKIGYPGIPKYLNANKDTLGINGVKVTHVWTQERQISESIAKTTKIDYVVEKIEDMIDHIDAVILARDDAQNHVNMAKPFIDANIPIFIDKPLAITHEALEYFSEEIDKGKFIMSCSSMRYSNECRAAKQELSDLGQIELVSAIGKKDWVKYGVHMLEAIFALLDDPVPVSVQHFGKDEKDSVCINLQNDLPIVVHIFKDITPIFQISLFGQEGWKLIEIKNSYSMFRDNIIEFIRSVQEGKPRLSFDKTERIVRTLIGAKESLANEGKSIDLINRA